MEIDLDQLAKVPQRYFDAWNGRDISALDDFFAPTFEWTDPMLPVPIDDIDGVHAFLETGWEGFPDIRFELLGGPLVDNTSGRVAQHWRMFATHDGEFAGTPATGNSCEITGADVFAVDANGRVTALEACYDAMTLMRELGFFEED